MQGNMPEGSRNKNLQQMKAARAWTGIPAEVRAAVRVQEAGPENLAAVTAAAAVQAVTESPAAAVQPAVTGIPAAVRMTV